MYKIFSRPELASMTLEQLQLTFEFEKACAATRSNPEQHMLDFEDDFWHDVALFFGDAV